MNKWISRGILGVIVLGTSVGLSYYLKSDEYNVILYLGGFVVAAIYSLMVGRDNYN